VQLADVDQGYPGAEPEQAAQAHGLALEVVRLPEAKKGFVLLPRRWIVERCLAWAVRFRRLVRDYERLPATVVERHWVAFVCLLIKQAVAAASATP